MKADKTFDTQVEADEWLVRVRLSIRPAHGYTAPPPAQGQRLGTYGREWIAKRDVKPRTRAGYLDIFEKYIEPDLGSVPITSLTRGQVEAWYERLTDAPTMRAHIYGLLRTMMKSAARAGLVAENVVDIEGASAKQRKGKIGRVATPAEIDKLCAEMPERLRAAVRLAAWCGMRYGEVFELRRGDVSIIANDDAASVGVVSITRGVSWPVDGSGAVVGPPKTEAGARTVAIPSALVPVVDEHLAKHVDASGDALLFPAKGGGNMRPSSFYKVWYPARKRAGLDGFRFHDLRHTGATYAARAGATLAELMSRIGHANPDAAMRYQHAVSERDAEIAERMSQMMGR